jgi:hypothetical protein
MDTSRHRTPPAPVSTGPPKGARTADGGTLKIRKSQSNFKRHTSIFRMAGTGCRLFRFYHGRSFLTKGDQPPGQARGTDYRVSGFFPRHCRRYRRWRVPLLSRATDVIPRSSCRLTLPRRGSAVGRSRLHRSLYLLKCPQFDLANALAGYSVFGSKLLECRRLIPAWRPRVI